MISFDFYFQKLFFYLFTKHTTVSVKCMLDMKVKKRKIKVNITCEKNIILCNFCLIMQKSSVCKIHKILAVNVEQ